MSRKSFLPQQVGKGHCAPLSECETDFRDKSPNPNLQGGSYFGCLYPPTNQRRCKDRHPIRGNGLGGVGALVSPGIKISDLRSSGFRNDLQRGSDQRITPIAHSHHNLWVLGICMAVAKQITKLARRTSNGRKPTHGIWRAERVVRLPLGCTRIDWFSCSANTQEEYRNCMVVVLRWVCRNFSAGYVNSKCLAISSKGSSSINLLVTLDSEKD